MLIHYRTRRAGGRVLYQLDGEPDFCCEEMCFEWGLLLGFGVYGRTESTSPEVNLFTRNPRPTWAVHEVRFCPFCGQEVRLLSNLAPDEAEPQRPEKPKKPSAIIANLASRMRAT